MESRDKLPKVANADCEAQYGYVYGVSGPGMKKYLFSLIMNSNYFIVVTANHMAGSAINELVRLKRFYDLIFSFIS
jgi:hypothetical protein